ncbi:uncharacterized protein LOC118155298 [Callithrix jacchus]
MLLFLLCVDCKNKPAIQRGPTDPLKEVDCSCRTWEIPQNCAEICHLVSFVLVKVYSQVDKCSCGYFCEEGDEYWKDLVCHLVDVHPLEMRPLKVIKVSSCPVGLDIFTRDCSW